MNELIEATIKELEQEGVIDPNCKSCQEHFYPNLKEGKSFSGIFAPNHKPSERCESGKKNHCSCDVCF